MTSSLPPDTISAEARSGLGPRFVACILAVVAAALLVDFLLAQRVPLDARFHWDGTYYIDYVARIDQLIREGSLDPYSITRTLPSAILHIVFRLFAIAPTPSNVLHGFVVLNGAAILAGILIWARIARLCQLDRSQVVFGVIAFFANFCFLKHGSFYPILTDISAFLISLGLVCCYLTRAVGGLVVLTIVGSFCWPLMLYIGVVLIVFPARRFDSSYLIEEAHILSSYDLSWVAPAAGTLFGVALALTAAWIHYWIGYRHSGASGIEILLPVSIAFVGIVFGLASTPLFAAWPDLLRIIGDARALFVRMAIAAMVVVCVRLIVFLLASGAGRNTASDFFLSQFSTAIRAPGISLVAHIVFFGPIVAVACLRWRQACRLTRDFGLGYVGVMFLTLIIALGSESRQLMANFPFVVVAVAVSMPKSILSFRFLAVFFVVSVALSRVWIYLPLDDLLFTYAAYLQYPWQWYFAAIGYWMRPETYAVHLMAIGALIVWLLRNGVSISAVGK